MGKSAKLNCISITQQLETMYFDWKDSELNSIRKADNFNDLHDFLDVIYNRLSIYNIKDFYAILHDKDYVTLNDGTVEYKKKHVHIVIKFEKQADTLNNIAYRLGLENQYIDKLGRGAHAYDNLLSYLTHVKYTDKAQYSPDEVITRAGRSYTEVYNERIDDWKKGIGPIKKTRAKLSIDYLEDLILTGQVFKKQVLLTDEYFEIYSRYKKRCEDAFDSYAERKTYEAIDALERGEFKLSAFYISGSSGSGKTRFANVLIANLLEKNKDWRCYSTASSNPFDDYLGEEVILMDDLRGSAMTASDWLKLLDPYHSSPASARYKNKQVACRVIIITSVKDVLEFFYYCKQVSGGDRSEALDQFLRRIQSIIEVIEYQDDVHDKLCLSEVVNKTMLTDKQKADYSKSLSLYTNKEMRNDIINMKFTVNRDDNLYNGEFVISKIMEDIEKNNNLNNEFYDF